jgi:beta-galactosidase
MRRILPLNRNWLFFDAPMGETTDGSPVDLPHSIAALPLGNFDENRYQKKVCYYKEFWIPEGCETSRAFLDFEAVAVSCQVWLNGSFLGGHKGAFTPFSFEITQVLKRKGANELWVEADGSEDPTVPPFGGVVDYLVYGGIYRAVNLRFQNALHIAHFHARPRIFSFGKSFGEDFAKGIDDGWSSQPCKAALAVELELSGFLGKAFPAGTGLLKLEGKLFGSSGCLAEASKDVRLDSTPLRAGSGDLTYNLNFPPLEGIIPWDIENPVLYDLEFSLYLDGERIDHAGSRVGFREAVFKPEGFFLNGRRVFLRGLNRHQSWPFAGYAMSPGAQRRDAEILKRGLGCVIVRTSHYPQSRHFLDACDELGLLVFTELPGWQHIGNEEWKKNALGDLESLVKRDRNHPSIILWGTRINESPDDDEFYARTNALAAALDPDRQSGGVRNFSGSAFFEDVYTFNDFTHDGGGKKIAEKRKVTRNAKKKAVDSGAKGSGKPASLPYLITEHNGHMFPTKRWDQEERLAEHARRHARVLDAAMGDSGTAGAIGWCAFDYNTHRDFGSGDRICYHGVSDIFRSPKYAAFLYSSQKSPREGIVLEPASRFAKGERDGAAMLPVEIYTNCDAVDLYRSGDLVGRFYPDRKTYRHLAHPPVLIDDLIGHRLDPEGFSPADKRRFLRIASKVMSAGPASLGIGDKLDFALLALKRGLSFQRAQDLLMTYGLAWGRADDLLELVGILDGKPVVSRRYAPDARAASLEPETFPPSLKIKDGGEWEASRVALRLIDQYGNTCPFAFEPIHIDIKGPGRLIGPADRSLLSGEAVFWVASIGEPGNILIEVKGPEGLPEPGRAKVSLEIDVELDDD